MLQFSVEDNLFVGSCRRYIVIRCNVRVRRADIILHADAGDDRTAKTLCQVLRVEIRQEGIHLGIRHRALVRLRYIGWPVGQLEVVGEVTHEGNSRSDGLEGASAQGSSSVGKRTTLTLTLGEEVIHIAGRAAGHEVDGTHTVHIGATIIIAVLVAEMISKPITIGVCKVLVDTIVALTGFSVIDTLSTCGKVELREFGISIAAWTVGSTVLSCRTIFRVVA